MPALLRVAAVVVTPFGFTGARIENGKIEIARN